MPKGQVTFPEKVTNRIPIKENVIPEKDFHFKLRNFEVVNFSISDKLAIFIAPNAGPNLTTSVFKDLALSLLEIQGMNFVVITRAGEVILTNATFISDLTFSEILDTQPDYIFFEVHTFFDQPYLLDPELMMKIKTHTKAKILGVCFDLWRNFDINCLRKWDKTVDNFIHMDLESAKKLDFAKDKLIFWPYAGWTKTLKPITSKDKLLFFSGNLKPPYRRKVLATSNKFARKSGVKFNINRLNSKLSKSSMTEVAYLNSLNSSQYVLSLSQKTNDKFVIPFRSLEAISLGCTVFQQETEKFSTFSQLFIPYEHYWPFKSTQELGDAIKNIESRHSDYVAIGIRGKIFMTEHYSPKAMWSYLINVIS
jgi:hypothetical protein